MTIHLQALLFAVVAIVIIYWLIKWSKQLENRRFTVFFYFLISTTITPLYSYSTENNGLFELWFPLGFIILIIYLYANQKMHPAKIKASLLGLAVAIYKMIKAYGEFLF